MTSETSDNTLFAGLCADGADRARPFILSNGETLSYGDMLDRSAQFARALVDAGLTPGDRVTVQARKSVDALLFYLGVIRAGGVYQPLNTAYTKAEVAYFLDNAEPVLVAVDTDAVEAMQELCARTGDATVVTLDRGHRFHYGQSGRTAGAIQ